jgi:hypothetical protein
MVDRNGRITPWRFTPGADMDFTARCALAGQAGSAEEDAFLWSLADQSDYFTLSQAVIWLTVC